MFDVGVRKRESFLEEIQAPFADAVSASLSDAWVRSPLSSAARSVELLDAQANVFADSEMLPADQARERLKAEGVERFLQVPEEGIRERALDLLIERKREELRRQDTMARAPGGIMAGAAYLGAGLVGSMLDPVNIAASFVPVVGQARYARWIAEAGSTAGRVGVRVGVGAVEGAAGAALVEPIVLAAARLEQADYDLNDSLVNIAFGTVLGGGLHVGAGAISDAIARGRRPVPTSPLGRLLDEVDAGTREAALRTGVAQATTGRMIDVEPILRADPRMGELMASTSLSRVVGNADALDAFLGQARAVQDNIPAQAARQSTLVPALTGAGDVRIFATLEEAERVLARADRRGPRGLEIVEAEGGFTFARRAEGVDALRTPSGEVRTFDSLRAAKRAADTVPAFRGAEPVPMGRGRYALVRGATEQDLASMRASPEIVSFPDAPDRSATAVMRQAEERARAGGRARFEAGLEDIRANAMRSFAPESKRLYDAEAIRVSEERIAEVRGREDIDIANDELGTVMDELRTLSRNLGDEDIVARELAAFNDLDRTAQEYGNAVRAAAACGLRRG